MITLEGILEHITYRSEESGYTVARLLPHDAKRPVTVVGALPNAHIGETLVLEGEWQNHPTHGRQFRVAKYRTARPSSVEGIRRYLGSGLIKGIGPATAARIVEAFGAATLDILDRQPERLREIKGLGRKKIDGIIAAWEEQRAVKDLILLLQDRGLPTTLASRIYKRYGDGAMEIVLYDPYRLSEDIYGIGFSTADRIALAQGVAPTDQRRLAAALRHLLSEAAAEDGHCYLPSDVLLAEAAETLQIDEALLADALDQALDAGRLASEAMADHEAIYAPPLLRAERQLAETLQALLTAPSPLQRTFQPHGPLVLLNWLRSSGIELSSQQAEAVHLALTSPVAVLTGGPGTGKTTSVRAILALVQRMGRRALLAAPTGRAARRLAESSGHEATTIHRLLEYRPGGEGRFGFDEARPLEADLVVIDEASMLDLQLAAALVRAVKPGAHLLLVGDADQLPSVGPGAVLRDLLSCWVVPSIQLTQIFRQAEGSGIIANAHRINSGEQPQLEGMSDFFLFPRIEPEACAEMVVELVTKRIPRRFGVDPQREIQVLAPMHKGPAGVSALNVLLQEALNPPRETRPELRWGGTTFRLGDRVLQLRNNYDLDVSNGDLGEITDLNLDDRELTVTFDGERAVTYTTGELDELALAYAISVHKGQGAEYPAVVLPLIRAHGPMLQRALLYTAVTRAKQLVVICGDERAIEAAVLNDRAVARWTGLAHRLREGRE